jgi:rRNA maturation endonuclease Nob1
MKQLKQCENCGTTLDRIYFSAKMTEEWTLNGNNWECIARHTLVNDPEQNVFCPECGNNIGTGIYFGFGK